ncbi:MAG: hypothetical protein R2741_13235 [Methanolobus sp.]
MSDLIKQKPGILSELGPFMDDIIGGLIGGVSANMCPQGPWQRQQLNKMRRTEK